VRAVEAFGQFEHVLGVGEDLFASCRDRKKELIHRRWWPAKRELGSAVFEYIKAFYNHERRRSTLACSTHEYEELLYAEQNQEVPPQRNQVKKCRWSGACESLP
jgi:hypothetical protein